MSLAHWCWSVVMYWDGYQERCYTDCWLSRRVRKAAKASFLRLLPVYSYASVMRKKETNKQKNQHVTFGYTDHWCHSAEIS